MLTRPEFDRACRLLIDKYAIVPSSLATSTMKGWSWEEHSSVPRLGYMSRTSEYRWRTSALYSPYESELDEELDEAIATPTASDSEHLTSRQYIVFSATFQVPCFYFTMYHSSGAPLSLDELVSTSLFQRCIVENSATTTFALSRQTSTFPLLSQGDHPTLGTPCWYLHPCETAAAVEELLQDEGEELNEDERLIHILEKWFMVLGSAVDIRA